MWTTALARQLVASKSLSGLRMASTIAVKPKLHVLQYEYVENVAEKRKPYREAHLTYIGQHVKNGNVVFGGAVGNPPTDALIIFRNLTSDAVTQVAKADPYVINGIVKKYSVEPYMAVVGDPVLKDDLIKI